MTVDTTIESEIVQKALLSSGLSSESKKALTEVFRQESFLVIVTRIMAAAKKAKPKNSIYLHTYKEQKNPYPEDPTNGITFYLIRELSMLYLAKPPREKIDDFNVEFVKPVASSLGTFLKKWELLAKKGGGYEHVNAAFFDAFATMKTLLGNLQRPPPRLINGDGFSSLANVTRYMSKGGQKNIFLIKACTIFQFAVGRRCDSIVADLINAKNNNKSMTAEKVKKEFKKARFIAPAINFYDHFGIKAPKNRG